MNEFEQILWRIPQKEEKKMDGIFIYRCDRCGTLTYPVQNHSGVIDYETPDESNVPDKCFMGHKWVLGVWEKA